jgi:hypothetical protein
MIKIPETQMAPRNVALYPSKEHEHKLGGRDGLKGPFALSELYDYVPDYLSKDMAAHYQEQAIPFRAVIPYHYSKWAKLQKGDLAIFYKDDFYYACATVAFMGHFHDLAKYAFKDNRTEKGELWDLFCFFEPTWTEIKVRKEDVNTAINYAIDRPLYSFAVIDEPAKVEALCEAIRR